MKKQKKPIFLVAVLVLVFGVVAAMNSNLLTTPTTPEEVAKQQEQEQAQAAAQAKAAAPKQKKNKDGLPKQSLVHPELKSGADDMPATNIKPIPAIDPKGNKIVAPIDIKPKQVTPDRASTQANSAWYYNDDKK